MSTTRSASSEESSADESSREKQWLHTKLQRAVIPQLMVTGEERYGITPSRSPSPRAPVPAQRSRSALPTPSRRSLSGIPPPLPPSPPPPSRTAPPLPRKSFSAC